MMSISSNTTGKAEDLEKKNKDLACSTNFQYSETTVSLWWNNSSTPMEL